MFRNQDKAFAEDVTVSWFNTLKTHLEKTLGNSCRLSVHVHCAAMYSSASKI